MAFIKRVVFVAFIAWLCYRGVVIFKTLLVFGIGTPIYNHAPGPCKILYVNGSEDIDVLPNGFAIISSIGVKSKGGRGFFAVRSSNLSTLPIEGKLYAFDFNHPDKGIKEMALMHFDKSGFIPHGIDFYTDPSTGETFLFVINHGGGKDSIEIFQLDQEQLILKHKKKVTDENIYHPNDVVAVGPDSFYVTNDRYFTHKLMSMVEVFYPLHLGNVVFYNGTNSKIVASQMSGPNGINIDKTGKYVYVAASFGGGIFVFMRKDDNSLVEQQEIAVGCVIDNIFVDERNSLWTGTPGQLFTFFKYVANFSKPCPAKALQVKLTRENNGNVPFKVDDIVEVYSSRGEGNFKAASSAVFYKGKLLIGTAIGNLMYCDVVVN